MSSINVASFSHFSWQAHTLGMFSYTDAGCVQVVFDPTRALEKHLGIFTFFPGSLPLPQERTRMSLQKDKVCGLDRNCPIGAMLDHAAPSQPRSWQQTQAWAWAKPAELLRWAIHP